MSRQPAFDAARTIKGSSLTQNDVELMDSALDEMGVPRDDEQPPEPEPNPNRPPIIEGGITFVTPRSFGFLASEEGMVEELYYDAVGVGTWALGVTNYSGHEVDPRYKDNPQAITYCIQVSAWAMNENYVPGVLRAFEGYPLKEHEFAAALSFHWNTGSIETTSWVDMVKEGDMDGARQFLETHYTNDGMLTDRREREAALFFDGTWPDPMLVPIYPVNKPSYTPDWDGATVIDITHISYRAMAKAYIEYKKEQQQMVVVHAKKSPEPFQRKDKKTVTVVARKQQPHDADPYQTKYEQEHAKYRRLMGHL